MKNIQMDQFGILHPKVILDLDSGWMGSLPGKTYKNYGVPINLSIEDIHSNKQKSLPTILHR